jgi:nitrite reductase/ring-hydroxylating ferredoxin subunit
MFVCKKSQVPESEVLGVDIPEVGRVAVYNVSGQFYITADECTHAKASLSEGLLDGNFIECPIHSGQFDVTNGKPVKAPCFKPLKIYPVLLEGDEVHINP